MGQNSRIEIGESPTLFPRDGVLMEGCCEFPSLVNSNSVSIPELERRGSLLIILKWFSIQ